MSTNHLAIEYLKRIFLGMTAAGFEHSKMFIWDAEINPETNYVCMYKRELTSVCVVFLDNCVKMNEIEYKRHLLESSAYFSTFRQAFKHVFIVHLVICDNSSFNWCLDKNEAFDNQELYQIYWLLNIGAFVPAVEYNPIAPTDIFGLKTIIKNSIDKKKNLSELENSSLSIKKAKENIRIKHQKVYLPFIIAGIYILIYFLLFEGNEIESITKWAQFPFNRLNGEYYRLFTSSLLHGDINHLASNCFGLFVFGYRVERYFGRVQFLIIYLLSGIFASTLSMFLTTVPSIGSSGAVYGLMGAVISAAFITKRPLDGLSLSFMLFYLTINFLPGFFTTHIDNFGHLGGFLGGLVISYFLLKRDLKKETQTQ